MKPADTTAPFGRSPAKAGGWADRGGSTTQPKVWRQLACSIRHLRGTAILSSEFLAGCGEPVLRRLASDLTDQNTTVFFNSRPHVKILPSSYQQLLKAGQKSMTSHGCEKCWNFRVATQPPAHSGAAMAIRKSCPAGSACSVGRTSFWPSRMRVRRKNSTTLSRGSSAPRRINRSLTWPEIEMLLEINRRFPTSLHWQDYVTFVRGGAIAGLASQPPPAPQDEPPLTPEWAIEQATTIARQQCEQISSLGISIMDWRPAVHAGRRHPMRGEYSHWLRLGRVCGRGAAGHPRGIRSLPGQRLGSDERTRPPGQAIGVFASLNRAPR